MRALILAAGLGSRLAPITDELPKVMIPVNGKPIIMKQIDNLHENGITDITVISGYKAEILEERIHEIFPDIKIIESVDYAVTNNMYSAYLGKDSVIGREFLMMNADVFYDASVLRALLAFDSKDAIVVDVGRYIEESMKVVEKDGHLIKISKKVNPEDALGSSIDVYKFSKEGGEAFFKKCAEFIEKGEKSKWSETALNEILPSQNFKACPLDGRWIEIDNYQDLAAATVLFAED